MTSENCLIGNLEADMVRRLHMPVLVCVPQFVHVY